jgi:hypothetical protein
MALLKFGSDDLSSAETPSSILAVEVMAGSSLLAITSTHSLVVLGIIHHHK